MKMDQRRRDSNMWNELSQNELWNKLQGMYHPERLKYFKRMAEYHENNELIIAATERIRAIKESFLDGTDVPEPEYRQTKKPVKMEDPKEYKLFKDVYAPKALRNKVKKETKKAESMMAIRAKYTKLERMNKRYLDI